MRCSRIPSAPLHNTPSLPPLPRISHAILTARSFFSAVREQREQSSRPLTALRHRCDRRAYLPPEYRHFLPLNPTILLAHCLLYLCSYRAHYSLFLAQRVNERQFDIGWVQWRADHVRNPQSYRFTVFLLSTTAQKNDELNLGFPINRQRQNVVVSSIGDPLIAYDHIDLVILKGFLSFLSGPNRVNVQWQSFEEAQKGSFVLQTARNNQQVDFSCHGLPPRVHLHITTSTLACSTGQALLGNPLGVWPWKSQYFFAIAPGSLTDTLLR